MKEVIMHTHKHKHTCARTHTHTHAHTHMHTQVSDTSSFISTWLVGYSALLGPVIGIIMADYFLGEPCVPSIRSH